MMKNKRLLISLVALLIASVSVFLMSSCTPNEGGDTNVTTTLEDSSTTTVTDPSLEENQNPYLEIIKDGVQTIKIIRSDDATQTETDYIAQFMKAFQETTGVFPTVETDFLRRNETRSEADDKAPAILIGNTNYSASIQECAQIATYNVFSVKVVGDQLVIATNDEYGLSAALLYLKSALLKFAEPAKNEFLVPRDFVKEKTEGSKLMLSQVPICNYGGKYTINSCGDDSEIVTVSSVKQDDYTSYIADLQNYGLSVYSENELGKNLYTTLTKDELILNVMFSGNEKKMYIISESNQTSALPPISDDRTGDYATTLTQLGLEYNYDLDDPKDPYYFPSSKYQIGNAYIFRLSDGSFIIMDGGFNYDRNAKMLYDELRSLQNDPTEKITIAAWIFSHVHGDHIGCFKKFMDRYKYEVNLEYVIYNSGNRAQDSIAGSTAGMESAAVAAIQYVPKARIIIARAGQKFVFRNFVMDMYMTSDLMPDTVKNGNSLCIAYKCTVEGQTFFFTGDSNVDESNRMVELYGSALKSDFEQINHHGGVGCTNELHAAIDPIVVLWPLGEYDYFVDPNNPGKITLCKAEYNKYLYSAECRVKEIILAGHTTRRITLPYAFPITRVDPVQTIVYR